MRLPTAERALAPHWYKDAIIYELHVKAFSEGNGGGVGDFAGLVGKLDYLERLGVSCVWLLPFYESPLTTATTSRTTSAFTSSTAGWSTSDNFSTRLTSAGFT